MFGSFVDKFDMNETEDGTEEKTFRYYLCLQCNATSKARATSKRLPNARVSKTLLST